MPGFDLISLTTDYGLTDGFAAACHGVIARLAPTVRVIDVTHLIPPSDVTRGSAVLAQTVVHLPLGVHVAIVDPGVGSSRRGIVIETPAGLLVGPDNGLLPAAATALGGVVRVVTITNSDWYSATVSPTFHGRDIFAPVAARLAAGAEVSEAGAPIDPDSLVRLPDPIVIIGAGYLEAEVITVDRFGNVQLAADGSLLAGLDDRLIVGGANAIRAITFADVSPGDLVVYSDSAGKVALAINGGRAVVALSVRPGDLVRIANSHNFIDGDR